MLTGVTYNVFLGARIETLLSWLLEENPFQDIYCFQEFPESKLTDIKKRLGKKGYAICFAPGFTWRGVTYGELTAFHNKLTLLETKTLSLGGKGEQNLVFIRDGLKFDVRIAKIQIDKSALVTVFRYGGRDFSLTNAHLSADVYNSRKLRQLKLVLEDRSDDEHAIILGDFNYAMGRELSKLMSLNGFQSVVKKQKTFRFAPGIYWQNDYVFQKNCIIESLPIKRVDHSDHYPIFFRLAF